MSEAIESGITEPEQKFFESGGISEPEPAKTDETFVEEKPDQTDQSEAVAETKTEPAPKKLVPLEALHEARIQNRELRAQMQRDADARKMLEQRFADLERKINPQNEVPSFDIDPITNLHHRVEMTAKQLEEDKQRQAHQQQEQQIIDWYRAQSGSFASQQKDFLDAYNAWTKVRAEELSNAGFTTDQANEQFRRDEMLIAASAAKLGINPAQLIYSIAQSKGYKPKPVVPQKSLETIKKGVESSKSLEQVSGKSTRTLTLESLAEMDDSDLNDKNWDAVMKTG